MSKLVAEIRINNWDNPPDIEVAGVPTQRIKVGEKVGVVLPPIFINNKKMPTLVVELEVRRLEDEGQLRDFYFTVVGNLELYKEFWLRREREAKSGVFLP